MKYKKNICLRINISVKVYIGYATTKNREKKN